MSTENCYRCGDPLDGYFRLLCDACREKVELEGPESEVVDK